MPFPAASGHPHSLAQNPLPPSSKPRCCISHHPLSTSCRPLNDSLKVAPNYIGPTWIIPDTLPNVRSLVTKISSAILIPLFHLSSDVQRFWRLRRTSLEEDYSAYHNLADPNHLESSLKHRFCGMLGWFSGLSFFLPLRS